jgi:hypothetical protein
MYLRTDEVTGVQALKRRYPGLPLAPGQVERREFEYMRRPSFILVRKLLKPGSFTLVEDVQAKVLAFIDYYKRAMAKPFKWTYQGKVLTA